MFKKALPIWLKDKENEMNVQARFVTSFDCDGKATLKIAGATYYKVFLNGSLVHYGPAPTAHGFARVDRIELDCEKNNSLVIEMAGYNCYAFACVKQTSFLRAEVVANDTVLAATGFDFEGYRVYARKQKVLRYSYQRHFTEIWDLSKTDEKSEISVLELPLKYLERRADLPDMSKDEITKVYSKGNYTVSENGWKIPSLQGAIDNTGDLINGFAYDEIDDKPVLDFSNFNYEISKNESSLPCKLEENEYAVFECRKNTCGLINLKLNASKDCKFFIAFDEKLIDGKFNYTRWETLNVIEVNCSGETDFTNFEIMGFKYFVVFAVKGSLEITSASVTKIINPIKNPPVLNCDDEDIVKIYEAGCESARCNTLAIFMDCPTRERAGWLCDSYFTSSALYTLEGNCNVEDDFVENYLNAGCKELPEKMLPCCYPADHTRGAFIPQWSMWFILELDEYKDRKGLTSMNTYKDLALGLLNYFSQFENELGLLENLNGWNFVEWSRANSWTKTVSFPTNMLYSKVLDIVGSWFDIEEFGEKAEKIRETVKRLSFNGKFFRDHAARNEEGELVCFDDISEVCQYYAIIFGGADRESYSELYDTLLKEFTPDQNNYPQIEKVNAFMGMYMRMMLLNKWGEKEQLLKEIKMFFGHMADITGTLWEHKTMSNSLNHGFTSYISKLLLEIYNN